MKIRFWAFLNDGPVRLTLRQDQSLSHSTGGPTDEGWSREWNVWTFDGQTVTCEYGSDGCDCDGRISHHGVSWFAKGDRASGNSLDGVTYPAWQRGEHGQRDYSAEAAGY